MTNIVELQPRAKERRFTCCICQEEAIGYGNNPDPIYTHHDDKHRCCSACDRAYVIPARSYISNLINTARTPEGKRRARSALARYKREIDQMLTDRMDG